MADLTSQLHAILSLLDDPDPVVQRSIRSHLFEQRSDSAPALRRMIQSAQDSELRVSAAQMLREMGIAAFREELGRMLDAVPRERDIDLEPAVFIPALLHYPDLHIADYIQQLDTMASALQTRLSGVVSGIQVIREMNRYLIEDLGFHGCSQESYYDPENSFMNCVLDRRIGIPVTLAAIYLLLAHRMRLPLFGVGFPSHFLLKFHSPSAEFYVDAFGGGMILSMGDCLRMLGGMGFESRPEYLQPIDNRHILARMMRNLSQIFRKSDEAIADELVRAIDAVTGGE